MPVIPLTRRIPGLSWCLQLPQRYGRANTALLGVLALAFATGVIFLTEAEKPWGKAVQKRLAKGQELQLAELVIIGMWWGVLAAVAVLLALLVTHRWWLPKTKAGWAADDGRHKSPGIWFYLFTLAAMGLCFWQAQPRLSQSLWNDEEYAMRRFSHGEWEEQKNGHWEFEPVSWQDTLFYSRNGNNHVISSVIVRWSLDIWRGMTGSARDAFSETAVRLPSLVAGIGSVALAAIMGALLGAPAAGIGAAFLLAFAPWHLHYAADGKGYSMLMFFMLLHYAGLIKALATNRLRWWLVFAVAQPLYLLSFAGSFYIAIATNLLALIELVKQKRFTTIPTLIAFGLMGAVPVFLWAGPVMPQMLQYLARPDALRLGMGWDWMRDLFSSLYLGFGYNNPLPEFHHGTSWTAFSAATPWLLHTGFAIILLPMLILAGSIIALLKNAAYRLVLLSPLLGALLSFTHNAAKNNPMVVWYFVFLLPFIALLISVATVHLARKKTATSLVSLTVLVAIYAFSVHDAGLRKRLYSRQPIRQTAEWIRQQAPDALTATWGVSDLQSRSYAPKTHVLKSLEELQVLEALAGAAKQPLYVFICGESVTSQRDPELTQHIRQSGDYKMVHELKGLEELFTYHVFAWQPKPAAAPVPQPPATVPAPAQAELPAAAGS